MKKITDNSLEIPDPGMPGPAMLALNTRRQAFVMACLGQGVKVDHTKAAIAAGYGSGSRNALHVSAHRLAHDEKIQAAILEEGKRRLQTFVPAAIACLGRMIGDEKVSPRERILASGMILDRGGIVPGSEHKITVNHNETREQKLLAIAAFCREAEIPLRQFLGNMVDFMPSDAKLLEIENAAN